MEFKEGGSECCLEECMRNKEDNLISRFSDIWYLEEKSSVVWKSCRGGSVFREN